MIRLVHFRTSTIQTPTFLKKKLFFLPAVGSPLILRVFEITSHPNLLDWQKPNNYSVPSTSRPKKRTYVIYFVIIARRVSSKAEENVNMLMNAYLVLTIHSQSWRACLEELSESAMAEIYERPKWPRPYQTSPIWLNFTPQTQTTPSSSAPEDNCRKWMTVSE